MRYVWYLQHVFGSGHSSFWINILDLFQKANREGNRLLWVDRMRVCYEIVNFSVSLNKKTFWFELDMYDFMSIYIVVFMSNFIANNSISYFFWFIHYFYFFAQQTDIHSIFVFWASPIPSLRNKKRDYWTYCQWPRNKNSRNRKHLGYYIMKYSIQKTILNFTYMIF